MEESAKLEGKRGSFGNRLESKQNRNESSKKTRHEWEETGAEINSLLRQRGERKETETKH